MKSKLVKCLTTTAVIAILTTSIGTINSEASSKPKLNKTKITLTEGKSYSLKVKGISSKVKVTWKSSKKSVATVSSKGKVKAKKKGTAVIKATFKYKKSGKKVTKTLKCKVTVKAKVKKATPTPKPTATPTVTVAPTATAVPTATPTATPTPTVAPTEAPVEGTTPETPSEPTEVVTITATPTVAPTETPVHVHEYTFTTIRPGSCTETCLDLYECECGDSYTKETLKYHDPYSATKRTVVHPTDTEYGYLEKTCGLCGETYILAKIAPKNAKESSIDDWVYTIKKPDRKHKYYYILVTDYIGNEENPTLHHSYTIDGREYITVLRGAIKCTSRVAKCFSLYGCREELTDYRETGVAIASFTDADGNGVYAMDPLSSYVEDGRDWAKIWGIE